MRHIHVYVHVCPCVFLSLHVHVHHCKMLVHLHVPICANTSHMTIVIAIDKIIGIESNLHYNCIVLLHSSIIVPVVVHCTYVLYMYCVHFCIQNYITFKLQFVHAHLLHVVMLLYMYCICTTVHDFIYE